MHGTVKGLFKLLGAVGMLAVVLSAWVVYRVSEGPLSLSPLTRYIEEALSRPADDLNVTISDTILTWSSETHSLQVEAVGVKMVKGGAAIASVPELSVRLSGKALLHGKLAARSVRLFHPALSLVRNEQGEISFGVGGEESAPQPSDTTAADVGIDALIAPTSRETLTGQLQSIEIVAASVAVQDRQHGLSWNAPRADLTFKRDNRGIALAARLDLLMDEQQGHLDADGVYLLADRSIDLKVWGGGVKPSSLARLAPQLDFLSAIQFPIGGSVSLHYQLDQGVTALSADVAAGEGLLDLTPVAGFAMPVKSIGLKAAYANRHLDLQNFRVDLGGMVLSADGKVDEPAGAMRTTLNFSADGTGLDTLPSLWPKVLAPNPRAWIAANLSHGRLSGASGTLIGHVPVGQGLGALVIDSLNGQLGMEDATVRYMPDMPKIEHVTASANFDADSFKINLAGGEVEGLFMPEGKVVLKGLSKADQLADITLRIDGTVADMLRFIDHKPLGWTSKFGIDPNSIRGDAQLTLSMNFPLVDKLSLDNLAIKVEADNKGLFMPKVVQNLDLVDGNLHLSIDNNSLEASGTAQIDHHPATIRWHENFSGKAAFRSRYQVSGMLTEDGRKLVGLGSAPFQPPFLKGALPMELTAVMLLPGRWDISVKSDLAPVELTLPGLNYLKPSGGKGQALAEIQLVGNRLSRIPRFRLSGEGNLEITGEVLFDQEGDIRRINLQHASFARSELSGSVSFRADGGLAISASGTSFDAREAIADRPTDPVTDKLPKHAPQPPRPEAPPPPAKETVPMSIEGHFDKVWMSDIGSVSNASAELVRDKFYFKRARIAATVSGDKKLSLQLTPTDEGHTSLVIESDDAGGVFRAMDLFDNMHGGKLQLNAVYDEKAPGRPLTGKLLVNEFQLQNAPVLARMFSLAGLTSIVDLLSGQGIHFTKLDMPFTYADGWLGIKDGQAAGSAMGITAKGRVDLQSDALMLEGTLVPAYSINSALGELPLVGGLFTAEKGGGLLAINYQMKGPSGDPSFIFNPLSALTPGFLRHLFDIFDTQPK